MRWLSPGEVGVSRPLDRRLPLGENELGPGSSIVPGAWRGRAQELIVPASDARAPELEPRFLNDAGDSTTRRSPAELDGRGGDDMPAASCARRSSISRGTTELGLDELALATRARSASAPRCDGRCHVRSRPSRASRLSLTHRDGFCKWLCEPAARPCCASPAPTAMLEAWRASAVSRDAGRGFGSSIAAIVLRDVRGQRGRVRPDKKPL